MVRRSVILLKKVDERRFRFRARFESPSGAGRWRMEDNIFKWLDQRVGKDNYALHSDGWEGHSRDCYALYFDDHTIIDDLPKTIPTAHAISATGCTKANNLHFNAAGYRLLGTRYGETMLDLLGYKVKQPVDQPK